MTQSLMQLDRYWQTFLEIKSRENRNSERQVEGSDEVELNINFNVMKHKTELKFRVPMEISLTWNENCVSLFQHIAIGLEGVFSFPGETSEGEIRKYVPLLCLTNLYGIARGTLAQATGLSPGGPFILPLVNMMEVIKHNSAANKELPPIEREENQNHSKLP